MSRFELPAGATLIGPDIPDASPRSPDTDMPAPRPAPIQELPETATPLPQEQPPAPPPRPNIVEQSMQDGYLSRIGADIGERIDHGDFFIHQTIPGTILCLICFL